MNAAITACLLAINVTAQFGLDLTPTPGKPKMVEITERARTRLYVRTIPPGAQVTLDGKPLGASDGLFLVPAGVGKLKIQFDGAEPRIEQIEVPEGRITRVVVDLNSGVAATGSGAPAGAGQAVSGPLPGAYMFGQGGLGGHPIPGGGENSKVVLFQVKETKPAPIIKPSALEETLEKPFTADFVEAPLRDICDFLTAQSKIEIRLDPRGLEQEGLTVDKPVTMTLKASRLSSILDLLAESTNLAWTIRDDDIVLTSEDLAESTIINRLYDVSDLTNDFDGLIRLIKFGPTESSWTDFGGKGRIEVDPADSEESIVVAQSEPNHRKIAELLRLLRQVREGKTNGMPAIAERGYWSQTESAKNLRLALDTPVQADLVDAPLRDFASFLSEKLACPIKVNERSLENNGIATDFPVTYNSTGAKRLESVLRTVLELHGLGFEIESDVLQIVAADNSHRSLAVYPVSELVRAGRSVKQIAHLVEQTTATGTWRDSGEGEGDLLGIDGTLQCLVVHQTTSAHREITSLLSRLRKPKK
jgi:hypothetical protein